MRTNTILGIILIVIAIVAFAYQGIDFTTREKVIDLGPVHMSADRTRTLPLPPIVGAIALVGGIVLAGRGKQKGLSAGKRSKSISRMGIEGHYFEQRSSLI